MGNEYQEYHEGEFQTHDPITGEEREEPFSESAPPLEQPVPGAIDNSGANATDAAVALADENGIDLSTVQGTGADGRITVDDVRAKLG